MRGQRLQIGDLPEPAIAVPPDPGGEVFDAVQPLVGAKERAGQGLRVQPQVGTTERGTQAVVKVEAIDVGPNSTHAALRSFCPLKAYALGLGNPAGDSISGPTAPQGAVSF